MREQSVRAHEDFASFYHETRDRCLRAVYTSTGDVHRAEDLVAEAYARALARWPAVSRHPAPAAWIVRTALNLHVSWWRRRRREYTIGLPHGDVEQFDAAARASTGYGVAGGSLGGEALPDPALLAILRSLPRRQREVVVLRILLDLDTAATARELGMAPGTVKVHLSRALATLRERLAPQVHFQMEEYVHD
jgi:DNA-directed RNA polymerase specialized sigma24 family protein